MPSGKVKWYDAEKGFGFLSGDDGADVGAGAPGELWLRGPCMFKGYLRNEDATRAALTPDGWFKTGDVLTRDEEGYFRVVDRKKELIKYKVRAARVAVGWC